jgi:hypothetical protein
VNVFSGFYVLGSGWEKILSCSLTSEPEALLTAPCRQVSCRHPATSASLAVTWDWGVACPRGARHFWFVRSWLRMSWWFEGTRKLSACGVDGTTALVPSTCIWNGGKTKPRALSASLVEVLFVPQSAGVTSSRRLGPLGGTLISGVPSSEFGRGSDLESSEGFGHISGCPTTSSESRTKFQYLSSERAKACRPLTPSFCFVVR